MVVIDVSVFRLEIRNYLPNFVVRIFCLSALLERSSLSPLPRVRSLRRGIMRVPLSSLFANKLLPHFLSLFQDAIYMTTLLMNLKGTLVTFFHCHHHRIVFLLISDFTNQQSLTERFLKRVHKLYSLSSNLKARLSVPVLSPFYLFALSQTPLGGILAPLVRSIKSNTAGFPKKF